jgi:hypothetical protein
MADPRRAITVVPSIATIQSGAGPNEKHYYLPLDRPVPYQFVLGDTTTDDGWTAIEPSSGTVGRFLDMPEPQQGADLADGNATIYVNGKQWRVLPAATLSANSTLTLSTTGAREGHWIEVTRLDVGAYTYAVVNGGPGAGTLCTMPVSTRAWGFFYFNGTNWLHRRSGLML